MNMNIQDLLCSEAMNLPLRYNDNEEFLELITKKFKQFKEDFGKLNNEPLSLIVKDYEKLIFETCDNVRESIVLYLEGKTYKSYEKFSSLFNKNKRYLLTNLKIVNQKEYKPIKFLYRARINDNTKLLKRNELFHIPFKERRKIKNERYSINGFPCLYLGSSVYVCCLELGCSCECCRKKLNFSRFEVIKDISYVDFAYFPDYLGNRLQEIIDSDKYKNNEYNNFKFTNEIISIFLNWPIIAASSTIVKDAEKPFKPEYIVPTSLMQWVRDSEDIDGIKYFSTKVEDDKTKYMSLYQNYAFPVKESKPYGYCSKLMKQFKTSDVVSCKDLGENTIERDIININEGELDTLLNDIDFSREAKDNEKIRKLWKTDSGKNVITKIFKKFTNKNDIIYHCISSFITNIHKDDNTEYINTAFGQIELELMLKDTKIFNFRESIQYIEDNPE